MRTNEQRVKSKGQRAAQGSGVRGQGSAYSSRIAVFLITLSGLILEVGLTRIYSASIWYHYAFVAVSVALLGWGLGGVALHLLRRLLIPTLEKAALLLMCYAAAIVVCLWVLVEFPFRLERLPLYFAAPLVPLVVAGMAQ